MVRSVAAFAQFELELFFKTLIAVFFTYLMPCSIYGALVVSAKSDHAHVASLLLPYFVGLIMVFVSLYTLATQVVTNREAGFYKRLLITKLNPVGIATSNTIRGYVLVLIGLAVLLIEGTILAHAAPRFDVIQALIAIIVAGGALFFLAMIPACFVKRASSMFAVASIGSYALVFFSGARPPLGAAGDALAHDVDLISPTYYGLRVLRAGFSGTLFQPDVLSSVAVLVAFVVLSVLVIRRYFTWM
jgi:hypothetical protein